MTVYFDAETHPFGACNLAPKLVCAQFQFSSTRPGVLVQYEEAEAHIREMLASNELIVVQNPAFDLAVICANYPALVPLVWEALDQRRVSDVTIREKLLMLAEHGYVDYRPLPNESTERVNYSLADIIWRRFQVDLSESKGIESWRNNFHLLDGRPLDEWPKEAIDYAMDDVAWLERVYASQAEEAKEMFGALNFDPFATEAVHVGAAFVLYLMSCRGVRIDAEERARVEAWVASQLTDADLEPLYASGILRRPQPARPYANQAKRVTELAAQGIVERAALEANGIKFTEPTKASANMTVLRQIIVDVCNAHGLPIKMTQGGTSEKSKGPQVATGEEVMVEIEHLDPRLSAWHHRQELQKLVTTELPRIQAPRVHFRFDVLKETGRTSSSASDKYPSANGQNVDPRVRGCYVPEPGWVICSVDYSTIELVTLAQKCIDLFGHSKLGELINKGVDPHAYLGAQMAYRFAQQEYERRALFEKDAKGWTTPDEIYYTFLCFKKSHDDTSRAFYAHWRKFAKPTGLGYPGGLGPDKFITYAKSTYGVLVTREQAVLMRELWMETYPEVVEYFDWVNGDCQVEEGVFQYMSPLGMVRNGASYCACANGAALQTPAAEGAKLALFYVGRACHDPSLGSILYGCQPWNFVHDEVIVDLPEDRWMHERAHEVARLWVQGMKHVVRDVEVRANPALMRRWSKDAEPVYDAQGRLAIWEPAKARPAP